MWHEIGRWRYDLASSLLKSKKSFSVEEGMAVLEAVKVSKQDPDVLEFFDLMYPNCGDRTLRPEWDNLDSWPWITVWSEIFDTNTLTMTYCLREDFERRFVFRIGYDR